MSHRSFRIPHSPFRISRALTLVEMLVALAVTMVMMAAVVNLFANISGSIRNRRAMIEVSGQLRQARMRLAKDLAGATCEPVTWQRPEENRGYIEIIEGEHSDKHPSDLILDADNDLLPDGIDPAISTIPGSQQTRSDMGAVTDGMGLGDWDDAIALTVRSEAEPFVAEVQGNTISSTLAEVVWYAAQEVPGGTPSPTDGMRKIYRRVLLIAPWLGPWNSKPNGPISVRYDGQQWVANTLGDLTKRENRITRSQQSADHAFPFRFDRGNLGQGPDNLMLADALAFDVRIYDPGAPLYAAVGAANTVLEPSDRGWHDAAQAADPVGYGAFCDLGWILDPETELPYTDLRPGTSTPWFDTPHMAGWHPHRTDQNSYVRSSGNNLPAVYDTWSYHYENDNVDQYDDSVPGTNLTDQGTNGIDDDGANGVDDLAERETFPPYNVPLRGVKVIMRVYERDARQTREVSVTNSF
jgi:type II secretory pathway component PulJ